MVRVMETDAKIFSYVRIDRKIYIYICLVRALGFGSDDQIL